MNAPRDPYAVLGVARTATADEMKRAFRELAKKFHPDRNKGDKTAEHKFKEINSAYDLLSDPAKRARFDRGEIDAQGNERGFGGRGGGGFHEYTYSNAGRGKPRGGDPFADFSAEDIFADLFGSARGKGGKTGGPFGGGQQQAQSKKGNDITYELQVTFLEAAKGGKRRVTLPTGRVVDLTVPPGTDDEQVLRLKGLGEPGRGGGLAGDALVTLRVEAHPYFKLKNGDVTLDLPVTVYEAALGATITVPTLDGLVAVKVPPGSSSGTQLRLKGKGSVHQKTGAVGDQYVVLKIVLPDDFDSDTKSALERWAKKHPYDPRQKVGL